MHVFLFVKSGPCSSQSYPFLFSKWDWKKVETNINEILSSFKILGSRQSQGGGVSLSFALFPWLSPNFSFFPGLSRKLRARLRTVWAAPLSQEPHTSLFSWQRSFRQCFWGFVRIPLGVGAQGSKNWVCGSLGALSCTQSCRGKGNHSLYSI